MVSFLLYFRRALIVATLGLGWGMFGADVSLRLVNQRELFLDDAVLETLHGVDARLATPVPAGVVLKFDDPWEGKFSGAFVSIIRDQNLFRMYYRGAGGIGGGKDEITCYAESEDGMRWRKPKLGLVEAKGNRDNNILLGYHPERYTHNFAVLLDDRPGVPAAQRYKAVGGGMTTSAESKATGAVRGLYRFVSADGIHWEKVPGEPLFKGYALDTQNVLAWIPAENCYAVYLRMWTEDEPGKPHWRGVRLIARSISKDFVTWSEPERMTYGDTPLEDLYTNATHPYFRAPQLLIAMPFRFAPERRILPQTELEALRVDKSMWSGVSDAVILTSRGGATYQRKFMESFVRPGPDRINWAARSTIPALGVIPTGPAEMSFFVTRAYGTPECRLERMTLRTDGFASLHAGYPAGYAITKPLALAGNALVANFATSSIGFVKIAVLDERGAEISGFTAMDAIELAGDRIDEPVKWKSGKTIADLGGRTVRLKFILRDADMYSFGAFER